MWNSHVNTCDSGLWCGRVSGSQMSVFPRVQTHVNIFKRTLIQCVQRCVCVLHRSHEDECASAVNGEVEYLLPLCVRAEDEDGDCGGRGTLCDLPAVQCLLQRKKEDPRTGGNENHIAPQCSHSSVQHTGCQHCHRQGQRSHTHTVQSDLEQYKTALLDTGCDLSPLNYIKQWKAFTKMAATPANYGNSGVKPMGLFSRVMNTGSQFVMEGVKNLVLKQHNIPVTRILDNLMEMKSHPETDDYRYFDPKMLRGSESSIPRNKNPFQEAVVFVVGGGNYIEYQNLVDYAKSKQGKKVIYGCSELFNAAQFIKQLSQLGQK